MPKRTSTLRAHRKVCSASSSIRSEREGREGEELGAFRRPSSRLPLLYCGTHCEDTVLSPFEYCFSAS